jgi:hypothetical protein
MLDFLCDSNRHVDLLILKKINKKVLANWLCLLVIYFVFTFS